MTLNSAVSSAGTEVSARDGDDTGGGGRSLPKLSSNGSGGARLNGSSHYPITHPHHHLHHQSSRNHVPPTRRSIFLEEGGGEGVEHELGGEHDFVDLSASPHEDFSSYHPQHFDDHQSMMIMMTHPSPPLSHSLCNDDSSLPPTNNNNNVNTKNNSLSSNLSSAASTPTSAVTVDSISNPKSGAGSPIVTSSKEGDSIRAASSPSTKAPVVVSERDRERRQYPERVGASTHAQQLKQQKKLKQNCLQKLQKEDLQQTVASVANSNGTVNGGGGIADAGNTNSSSSSSCLVQTGDHTYRIPDGEKCTVKVGDKIRIIHGPAILNFASSDGLMTSVMGGDVPKLSKFRSSEITSLHLVPNDASATELNISASLGSSPNRSDDDGSGRHSEDQSNFEDCKSRDEMIGYESPSKVDQMGDCYRNSSRKLFHNDTFGEHQANEFEGSWNPHDSSSESMKHNNSFKSSRLQCFENNPKVGNGASVLNSERVGDGELARMLHVDIEMTDLALNNSSSSCEGSNNKSSNSRHVSPCSEKSHDSSYSSSSCGSSKSPDVLSPVNQNRPPAAATAATVNKRTKRKVKLVPYQDTNSAEYVDKVKCALSSVGMPSVTDIETCSAKVAWSGCNRSLFPGGTGDQTSSTNVAHKICYNLSYGKRVAEQNKVTISCGSQTEYTLTCLSPGQCYEVLVWANVDEIQGSASALVTFSSKHSPPERPNAPVLKSASKNSLVVAWQPANVSTNHSSGGGSSKNIIYKLFAAEESQTLDLTATVASKGSGSISGATTGGGGKHGAVSSGGRKNKGGGSSSSGGGCGGAGFEYESHLRYEGCQRSAKVDHLNPNTSYKFQLIVSNSEGSSEPSEEVVFTTLSVQPPQPDPPTLVYRDTYNIRLNWKSYLTKHAALLGKLVPEFTLQMEDQKKNQHGFVTQYSGPETCYTVANLPRSSKFKFKLFAEIGCLKSATSEPVVFSTRDCVPHAPTGLNCTDITSNKCTLRWEKPVDDGGSEVTQYIVERSISGGLFQEIYHGVDTCLPISSLFPGMEYHFRVAAENSVGRGMFSTSCPCHTKPVVPAQCSHPNVSGRIKPHSVHIAWLPPDYDGGSRILQYAVKQITDLSKPSDGFEISRDVRRDLIVFQLSPGTVYGFSVCAINSVGRGPWSVPLEVQTAPDKPPAPEPPRVVFSPKSSSSTYARITWCAPSFDNGSPITEYRLEGCEDTTLSLDGADMTSLGGHLVEPFSVAATGCPALGGASMSDHILESHYGSYSSCSSSPPGGVLGGSASMTSSSSSKYMQQQSSYSSLSSAGGGQHSGGANCSSGSSSSGRNSSHHHPHHHPHHLGPQQPLAAGVPASIPGSKRNSFNNYHHNHHHHDSAAAVNSNSSNGGSSATPASQSDRRSDHHHRSGGNAQHPNGHTPLSMLSRKSHNQVSSSGGSNGVATTSVVPAPPSWFQLYRGVKLSFDYKSIKPATAYKFRVQAVNNIGASAHSKETFIMSPCSAPSAVLNVVPEATVDSVQLSWDVPECNGAPILSYYIDCSCPTNATTTTAGHRNNSTSSTSRSSNHHNSASTNSACGSYETVSARSGGANDNSSDSMFTLQHNQFEQSSSSASSANQKRSSSPNISFQRRTSNDDKTWQLHSFYECDSNSYVINNLRADTLYKIRVRACNENGNGPFSATVKVQTLCLPPEPPLLECVSATASSLRLRWGEASAASGGGGGGGGGSSSKEVTYHLQMEDKSGRFQNTYSGSAVSYRVIRLQEQTSYTFRINASNEAGHGPYSQLYCFSTTKSPPSPPMKAPRVKTVKGDVHSAGFVEASWVAANPCGDDKVLYQLMMATGPSFNEFVVAYKGSGTTCRIENLVKSYCGRSSSQSGSGHNDFRLKVCAIRQCQDDKQEIFGQYSPLCSFQYSASMGHSNSNYGNSGHHSHGASGNSNNNNNNYFSHSNASVLSSSTSAHSHNHVSSFRGHASHSSHSNHNVQSSSCEAMVSTKHNHHLLCDSSANTSEESADSSALCKRGYSLGSSRIGCALKRKFSQWAKKLTDFHPNDTQIAVMVLILFVIVLIAIAVYLQQNFTSF